MKRSHLIPGASPTYALRFYWQARVCQSVQCGCLSLREIVTVSDVQRDSQTGLVKHLALSTKPDARQWPEQILQRHVCVLLRCGPRYCAKTPPLQPVELLCGACIRTCPLPSHWQMSSVPPTPITSHVPVMVDVGMQHSLEIGFDLDLSQRVVGRVLLHGRTNNVLA